MTIVVGQSQRLNMGKQFEADVGHQALAKAHHHDPLNNPGQARPQIDTQHQQDRLHQSLKIGGGDVIVNRPAKQDRPGQI